MSDLVIQAEHIYKQYRLGKVGRKSLHDDINRWMHKLAGKEDPYLQVGDINDRTTKASSDYVWALQDVSFSVKQGDVLGVLGRNGAGKSTLLKILSKVTAPTKGSIKIKGRIASLLEVGTGFHPELSGRDNIFLNGAILGMTRKEIQRKFDEIVAFAGVERYIDTPVKRYSSGMYVRLAFAVAAHLEPDILIVDEVLAVGDAEFQKKCLGKMKDVSAKDGRTILFVSHNIVAIKTLCTSGILLENGKKVFDGEVDELLKTYQKGLIMRDEAGKELQQFKPESTGLTGLQCNSKSYNEPVFRFGEPIYIETTWHFEKLLKNRVIAVRIYNFYDEFICGFNTLSEKFIESLEQPRSYKIKLTIDNKFVPGRYKISIGSYIRPHTQEFIYNNVLSFEVLEEPDSVDFLPNIKGDPKFYLQSDWEIQ